jgi:hypothetical protein
MIQIYILFELDEVVNPVFPQSFALQQTPHTHNLRWKRNRECKINGCDTSILRAISTCSDTDPKGDQEAMERIPPYYRSSTIKRRVPDRDEF